jgi:transcription initiation factor IIE alpha subunit|nr:MAG TPA: hypothetical protein [Bacteriophage sp.]
MMNEEKTNDVVARNGCHKVNQLLKELNHIVFNEGCHKRLEIGDSCDYEFDCSECNYNHLEKLVLEIQVDHLMEIDKLNDEIDRLKEDIYRLNDEIWDLEQDVEYWQDSYYEKLEEDELDFERNENY